VSRGLKAALAGCLLSGALLLLAGGQTWVRLTYPDRPRTLPGSEYVPSLSAWGLLALAGVVAVAATRRWGRIPVGAALAAAGSAAAALTADALRDYDVRALGAAAIRRIPGDPRAIEPTAWPYVAFAAAVLLAATGVLVATRGPRWAGLSGRYDAPADRPKTDADLWAALDRGEDPTEPAG
jgi:uncharacterized membrane protein (TIGR02234 family)